MSFLNIYFNDLATYWKSNGLDGFGQPTFNAPVTIKCRWEDKSSMITTDLGFQTPSRSVIFLDDDVEVGDYLYKGEVTTADPRTVKGAFQILSAPKIPGLFGSLIERRAYL